ncbi:hypothetical protein ADK92_31795 [Streptomyces sp. XY533]|nr:hypothetical protein ADK92_31795 [Streptomyces sp. XY533]
MAAEATDTSRLAARSSPVRSSPLPRSRPELGCLLPAGVLGDSGRMVPLWFDGERRHMMGWQAR